MLSRNVVMIGTVAAFAAWAVSAAPLGRDGASLAAESKAQPPGEIEMTVEPTDSNVDTSGAANSEDNTKADASASASASANAGSKSSGQGGCQARSSATASASANGQNDYDHDEDFETTERGGCSATAHSSATATTRSD